jgi:hypothetical protein
MRNTAIGSMYLHKVEIKNIRSIARFEWQAPEDPAGWHVLIGDNGSGKTTILRSIALALLGASLEASKLREDWRRWVQHRQEHASIRIELLRDPDSDPGDSPTSGDDEFITVHFDKKLDFQGIGESKGLGDAYHGGHGWFSASYGPFRRFVGDDEEDREIYRTHPRLARHITCSAIAMPCRGASPGSSPSSTESWPRATRAAVTIISTSAP